MFRETLESLVMTPLAILALGGAIVATSLLSGIFGMAGGLVLVGILLAVLPLPVAMALHAVTQIASNLWRAALWWRHVRWRIAGAYVAGCLLAVAAWSLWLYVPDTAVALLMLGVTPFLARLLPPGLQADPGHFGHGILNGAVCMTLMLLTGVAGPLLDSFFLNGRLDRREIVATKGVCQVFGHAFKLVYFGGLIAGAATLDPVLVGIAIAATLLGTSLARRVLESMSNTQYRTWATRLITVVAGYYVVHGTILMAAA